MEWKKELDYYKYDPLNVDFAKTTFNIKKAINDNLDKTKAAIMEVRQNIETNEEALAKKGNCLIKVYTDKSIQVANWITSTTEHLPTSISVQLIADYPFMADIPLPIDDTWKADILPDLAGQEILAPINVTYAGNVRLYAKEKPAATMLLLNLELRKEVV
ncbi:MAG: hypothetical protein RR536_01875 [Anaerovoracaceae bacterium]